MKKFIYRISALLLVAGLATSCMDEVLEVESQSTFDEKSVYSDYNLAEFAVFGIPEVFAHTNCYRGRINGYYGTNTDVELYNTSSNASSKGTTDTKIQKSEYNVQINDTEMNLDNGPYNELLVGIERANLAISGLRKYGNLGDANMAYLLGEALTYRAFIYFELIKLFGEVPLKTEMTTGDMVYIGKTDRDDIYEQILADLEEAIDYLYWPYESTQTSSMDRMNKAFAKGLYARIAMNAAGYAFRPDEGLVNTGNAGSLRLTTRESLKKETLYPKALQHLQDVIEHGSVGLEPDYETLWRKFNNLTHLTSKEVLWVMPFSDGRCRWNYHHAARHTAGSEYIGGGTSNRGGDTGPNPTLWWKYEKEDVRRDLTCVPFIFTRSGKEGGVTKSGTGYELAGRVNKWYWGKYRFEWMEAVPYTGGNDDGCKPIIMRYSDVLLMASELAAWSGDIDLARNCLLEVRQRAYKGNEHLASAYVNALSLGSAAGSDDASINDYQQQGTIMKAIIDERALEFAGEMLRKQDLIRWGLLKLKLDEASADMKALSELTGAYSAYAAYAKNKEVQDGENEDGNVLAVVKEYSIFWRPVSGGIQIFGLEKDEIGKTPEGYNGAEDPGDWYTYGYISPQAFFSSSNKETGTWDNPLAMRYNVLYRNEFNDPYPRSVWPIFGVILTSMQGAMMNDYGYPQL